MADDGQQGPVFSDPEAQMLELAKHGLHAAQVALQMAEMLHERAQNGRAVALPRGRTDVSKVKRPGIPQNVDHRSWRGFVLDLQRLERICRDKGMKVNKTNVAGLGADSPKTITRTMEWHGLNARDWPPSTWNPEVPPAQRA